LGLLEVKKLNYAPLQENNSIFWGLFYIGALGNGLSGLAKC